MMDKLRRIWFLVRTPLLQWVDRVLCAYLRKRGYVLVEQWALSQAQRVLQDTAQYVDRSGHFSTVKGRKPRSVNRVTSSLGSAFTLLRPATPALGAGAKSPARVVRDRVNALREHAALAQAAKDAEEAAL